MDVLKNISPALKQIIINVVVFGVLGAAFFMFARQNFYVFCFYEFCFKELTLFINFFVEKFLNLFPCFDVEVFGKIICDKAGGSLVLDRGCVGRNVMLAFAGFIIIWPEKFLKKIAYIAFGLVVIVFFNVIRISSLMFTQKFYPDWFDFNHGYLFKYTLYAAVFLLWVLWFKINERQKKAH